MKSDVTSGRLQCYIESHAALRRFLFLAEFEDILCCELSAYQNHNF